jgi:hypothetical protein
MGRPSICSIVSDETINRNYVFGGNQQSSTKELSSHSGAKNLNTEERSYNRRYGSNSSFDQSPSIVTEEDEENQELAKLINQSYIRRSTDFDGKNTPNMTENANKRRASSARSRESFFIPHIFKEKSKCTFNDR